MHWSPIGSGRGGSEPGVQPEGYIAVYFLALAGCPMMMIAWAMALVRPNRIYLRVNEVDDGEQLLEASIAISVVIGILILVAWLVLFSHGGGPVEGPSPG